MRFVALVRPVVVVAFEADVPELRAAPSPEVLDEHAKWEEHQAKVLDARAKVARRAEREAKAALKGLDVQETLIVEVREEAA